MRTLRAGRVVDDHDAIVVHCALAYAVCRPSLQSVWKPSIYIYIYMSLPSPILSLSLPLCSLSRSLPPEQVRAYLWQARPSWCPTCLEWLGESHRPQRAQQAREPSSLVLARASANSSMRACASIWTRLVTSGLLLQESGEAEATQNARATQSNASDAWGKIQALVVGPLCLRKKKTNKSNMPVPLQKFSLASTSSFVRSWKCRLGFWKECANWQWVKTLHLW